MDSWHVTEWQRTTIAGIASKEPHALATGPFGSAISAKNFVKVGVPVIRGSNLSLDVGVRLNDDGLAFLTEGKAAEFKRSVARRGDLVFTCWGTVGQVGLVDDRAAYPEYVVSNKQMKLTPDPAKADSTFLYYLLSSPEMVRSVTGQSIGAAVPGFNLGQLKELVVTMPPLDTQIRAASLLTSFDDLIENNRRRAEVLEEMARAVYREWFIKFRYPGHEGIPVIDSARGPIPEGWSASTCGVQLNSIGGGTPSKKVASYWEDGTVAWYTPTDLTRNGFRYAVEPALRITEQGVAESSARLFPVGSVLMTSRATLGVLAIATTEATTNQGFIVILPDDRWNPGFIYEWLDSNATELAALGTGATFKEITKGAFKSFPFVLPAQYVLDAYRATTDPIEQLIQALERQVRRLSELRDFLLPKLVTGQIDVSSLDLHALVGDRVA